MRDCLLDAQSKRQNKQATAIKLKLHQEEETKRMWYLIQRRVKDPHSPSVLKTQRVVEGEIKEYTIQEDVEQASQRECKVRFLLAHSAPIMNTLLGEKLRYLLDESLAKFSFTIQIWYDRIHTYLQLIRLKEGKASNASNIVRFAKHSHQKTGRADN